ncbi:hypothetical protein ACA910_009667 [Epithemia clementina (nom. ined.)]
MGAPRFKRTLSSSQIPPMTALPNPRPAFDNSSSSSSSSSMDPYSSQSTPSPFSSPECETEHCNNNNNNMSGFSFGEQTHPPRASRYQHNDTNASERSAQSEQSSMPACIPTLRPGLRTEDAGAGAGSGAGSGWVCKFCFRHNNLDPFSVCPCCCQSEISTLGGGSFQAPIRSENVPNFNGGGGDAPWTTTTSEPYHHRGGPYPKRDLDPLPHHSHHHHQQQHAPSSSVSSCRRPTNQPAPNSEPYSLDMMIPHPQQFPPNRSSASGSYEDGYNDMRMPSPYNSQSFSLPTTQPPPPTSHKATPEASFQATQHKLTRSDGRRPKKIARSSGAMKDSSLGKNKTGAFDWNRRPSLSQQQQPTKDVNLSQAVAYLEANDLSSTYVDGTPVPEDRQLLVGDDRLLLTDYTYYLMKQLRHCQFSERDRKTRGGKRETISVGFGGLECVHCARQEHARSRKFFWAHADRLANSFAEIPTHILKCAACPRETQEALLVLKAKHQEQMPLVARGSQKVYFRRMWFRIQNNVGPPNHKNHDYNMPPQQQQQGMHQHEMAFENL